MTPLKKLENYRKQIDGFNSKLCSLLNRRAKIAIKIGFIKKGLGLEIYAPKREKQILKNLNLYNKG
ncbi:MAG: chorismate mutase, partial [bacterium]